MLDLWRKDLSRIRADLLPVLANNVREGLDDEAPIRGQQYVILRDLCVCWGWVEPGCVQLEGRSGLAAHVCHPFLEPGGSPRLFSGKVLAQDSHPNPASAFGVPPASHLLESLWSKHTSHLNPQSRERRKMNIFNNSHTFSNVNIFRSVQRSCIQGDHALISFSALNTLFSEAAWQPIL